MDNSEENTEIVPFDIQESSGIESDDISNSISKLKGKLQLLDSRYSAAIQIISTPIEDLQVETEIAFEIEAAAQSAVELMNSLNINFPAIPQMELLERKNRARHSVLFAKKLRLEQEKARLVKFSSAQRYSQKYTPRKQSAISANSDFRMKDAYLRLKDKQTRLQSVNLSLNIIESSFASQLDVAKEGLYEKLSRIRALEATANDVASYQRKISQILQQIDKEKNNEAELANTLLRAQKSIEDRKEANHRTEMQIIELSKSANNRRKRIQMKLSDLVMKKKQITERSKDCVRMNEEYGSYARKVEGLNKTAKESLLSLVSNPYMNHISECQLEISISESFGKRLSAALAKLCDIT